MTKHKTTLPGVLCSYFVVSWQPAVGRCFATHSFVPSNDGGWKLVIGSWRNPKSDRLHLHTVFPAVKRIDEKNAITLLQ